MSGPELEAYRARKRREGNGGDPAACPTCGRDACEDPSHVARATTGARVAESLRAFMARVRQMPEPEWFVKDLIPDEGVVVWHGRPRSMKSLTGMDTILSLALGESHALGTRALPSRARSAVSGSARRTANASMASDSG